MEICTEFSAVQVILSLGNGLLDRHKLTAFPLLLN
jgi:hypothetical protein